MDNSFDKNIQEIMTNLLLRFTTCCNVFDLNDYMEDEVFYDPVIPSENEFVILRKQE